MLHQMLSRVRAETPRATFGIKYLVKGPKQIQLWSSSKGTSQNSMTITSTLPLIMVKILPLFLTNLPKWWTTSKRPLIKNKKFVKTPGITKMIGSDFAKAGMISGVPLQNFQTPIFQTPRLILPRLVNVSTPPRVLLGAGRALLPERLQPSRQICATVPQSHISYIRISKMFLAIFVLKPLILKKNVSGAPSTAKIF